MSEQQPIGQATMEDDGTIVLDLFPSGEQGELGIAQFRISPTDAEYQSTLEHVGGLQPGEQKLVPPWPEEEG